MNIIEKIGEDKPKAFFQILENYFIKKG